MIELLAPLCFSAVFLGIGCFMVYSMFTNLEKWDAFWENQNRRNPLMPNDWAASTGYKLLSYVGAIMILFVGGAVLVATILDLWEYMSR